MKSKLYLIVAFIGLFSACKKGELVENTAYEKIEPGNPAYSYVKFLNLTPGSPAINYYLGGVKTSAGYSTLGVENAGYGYNGLFPDLGYAIVNPGKSTLTGKIIPSASVDGGLEVLNTEITPEGGKYYTIFTTGEYTLPTKKIPSVVMLEDVRPATDTTKIFIRLVNMYRNGPNLDMLEEGSTQKIVSNVAYGTASEWVTIPNPGKANKYFFDNAATGAHVNATAATMTLTKGRAYTIYLRGVAGSTAYPFAGTYYTTFY